MSAQEPKEEGTRPLCPLLMVAGSIGRQLKTPPQKNSLSVLDRSPSTVCIEGACAWWLGRDETYNREKPARCAVAR